MGKKEKESWAPTVTVALLLGGALFWLARESDRLAEPGVVTVQLLVIALIALLGGRAPVVHRLVGPIVSGLFVLIALIVLGLEILVPRTGSAFALADQMLGRGVLAPIYLGVWLLLLLAMAIYVVALFRWSPRRWRTVVAAVAVGAVAAGAPWLGAGVAGPVHRAQTEIAIDHTTADHPRVMGSPIDGPTGPLHEQWTGRLPGVDYAVVGDTVLTYRDESTTPGFVALDADTGVERWRFLTPELEEAGWGAVASPSTGLAVLPIGDVAVLLDIGSGEQVDVVELPGDGGWSPIMDDSGSVSTITVSDAAVLHSDYQGNGETLIAIEPASRAVTVLDEQVASTCLHRLVNDAGPDEQFLLQHGCGPTEVTTLRRGVAVSRVTVPPRAGSDCGYCMVFSAVADRGRLLLGIHDTVPEIVAVRGERVEWRHVDDGTLYPVHSADSGRAHRVAVEPARPSPPRIIETNTGTVVATPDVPVPDLATADRWFVADGSTVTAIDTTTWQVISTTDIGCYVTALRGGGHHVVALCDNGRLIGLSDAERTGEIR